MNRQSEIQISWFQLVFLLDEERMHDYNYLLEKGVFCVHCRGVAEKGIVVEKIYLTSLNDIMVKGKCKVCNGNVARIMEFGEDEEFFSKANVFRKSIGKFK
ncbi:MAG: hypothetical protein KA807_00180 [Prolixibacteraceae bacterium]|nr:hypothetical protein [Prolixibacteraceae bacterium]